MKFFCLLALLVISTVSAQSFVVNASVAEVYQQGTEQVVSISVQLAEGDLTEAVVFLNVVENRPGYPQAAHKIFASASEEPPIFQQVFSGAQLAGGINTTLSFQLKKNAKLGAYSLVLQVFGDGNTDPHRVNAENRVAMKGFNFTIVESD